MSQEHTSDVETDPRFPSGRWTGYFLQAQGPRPGRSHMELLLTFRNGTLTGEGRDWVGSFTLRGQYDVADGKCHWDKRYPGRHYIIYQGYNEGKGIWGTWEIPPEENYGFLFRGGFHIWPEGMAAEDPSTLHEEADLPVHVEELVEAKAAFNDRMWLGNCL